MDGNLNVVYDVDIDFVTAEHQIVVNDDTQTGEFDTSSVESLERIAICGTSCSQLITEEQYEIERFLSVWTESDHRPIIYTEI